MAESSGQLGGKDDVRQVQGPRLDTSSPDSSAASGLRVKLTTHKVVIDANDEAHAADLYERLHNDGFRVHRETHRLVQDDLGYMSKEVERVR